MPNRKLIKKESAKKTLALNKEKIIKIIKKHLSKIDIGATDSYLIDELKLFEEKEKKIKEIIITVKRTRCRSVNKEELYKKALDKILDELH